MSQIYQMSALQMRSALDAGELSSVEIVEALHRRSDEVDDRLRGYVYQYRRRALEQAQQADERRAAGESLGVLDGLPITVKENIATAGEPSTFGVRKRMGQIEERDAVVVDQVRQQGAVILGKSNIPQLLFSAETVNPIWGRSYNPWDLARSPGGSSGGEGALIASGQSVLGLGTDIAGSIRIPAAFCGIAGIKPTEDRWSYIGCRGAVPGQEAVRAQVGPMARSSAEVAFFMGALDPRRQARVDPAVPPLALEDPSSIDLKGLRVGMYVDDGFFEPSGAQKRVVEQSAAYLRALGVEVVPHQPVGAREVIYCVYALLGGDGGAKLMAAADGEVMIKQLRPLMRMARMPDRARRLLASGLELAGDNKSSTMLRAMGEKSVERYWDLTKRRDELRHAEHEAWERAGLDALICPAFPCAPFLHDESHDMTAAACYTMRYNVLNLPAGVAPVSVARPGEVGAGSGGRDRMERKARKMDEGSEGMPLGVQVVGRRWREDVVLRLMMAIEASARQEDDFPSTPVTP